MFQARQFCSEPWISTSIGRHNRKTGLFSFRLSPQLSCEDFQAGGSFVSVSLQMSSTVCQHYKSNQLMLSLVLMGFLRLSWRLCLSLNCSPIFPFREVSKECHIPSQEGWGIIPRRENLNWRRCFTLMRDTFALCLEEVLEVADT